MNIVVSYGQWGLFDRQFGRSDAEDPDPDGRILQWERASVQEMKDKFSAIGFGPRQVFSSFLISCVVMYKNHHMMRVSTLYWDEKTGWVLCWGNIVPKPVSQPKDELSEKLNV